MPQSPCLFSATFSPDGHTGKQCYFPHLPQHISSLGFICSPLSPLVILPVIIRFYASFSVCAPSPVSRIPVMFCLCSTVGFTASYFINHLHAHPKFLSAVGTKS
ncbi:hypothetical protein GOODEAATRI_031383 [Goodea atripinnis]|uniref:Uncharacterized protein n=1 Tax=Goodea atripinnis TaxID=208336 RepID=A0ABV0NPN1_9TELE